MNIELNCGKLEAMKVSPKDISDIIKGLKLLGKKVNEIYIHSDNIDLDTKYYHKFDEELINKIYMDISHGFSLGRLVISENNNIYTLEGIKLPNIFYSRALIRFE